MPAEPAQEPSDDGGAVPAPVHDDPAPGSEPVADGHAQAGAVAVLHAAGLLMQEVRAAQADRDLGVIAEGDHAGRRLEAAAAPALGPSCGVVVERGAELCHADSLEAMPAGPATDQLVGMVSVAAVTEVAGTAGVSSSDGS